MNREEMVRGTQNQLNAMGKGRFSKADAADVLDGVLELIRVGVVSGEGLTIRNFGAFKVRQYQGKSIPNPQGEGTIAVPPYKVVSFSASQRVKDEVNGRV